MKTCPKCGSPQESELTTSGFTLQKKAMWFGCGSHVLLDEPEKILSRTNQCRDQEEINDLRRKDADRIRELEEQIKVKEFLLNQAIKDLETEQAKNRKLEDQLELMTCKAAGWQNQATIEAKALVECWEKAERYRLEANAMMAQRDEAQRKVAELQAGLDDIEEYGTEEINAAVDLRHQLAAALVERDELKSEKEASYQCLLMLERDLYKAREERDKAISVAERLIEYAHECLAKLESWGQGYKRYEDDMDRIREDIAAYNMMKEGK